MGGLHFLTEEINACYSLKFTDSLRHHLGWTQNSNFHSSHAPFGRATCVCETQLQLSWWFHSPVISVTPCLVQITMQGPEATI